MKQLLEDWWVNKEYSQSYIPSMKTFFEDYNRFVEIGEDKIQKSDKLTLGNVKHWLPFP